MSNLSTPKGQGIQFTKGRFAVDDDGSIYRVKEINDKGEMELEYSSNGKWFHYGTIEPYRQGRYTPLDSPDEIEKAYLAVTANPDAFAPDPDVEGTGDTSLAVALPLSTIQSMKAGLEKKNSIVRLAKIHMEMKKRELDRIMSALMEKVHMLQKIIAAIELYLGTNEQVVEIATGLPEEGPVYLRQAILFMDEEFGDPHPHPETGQPGLDFQTVADFDGWLLKNIDRIMPERKGILAMKPSRQSHSYSDNIFLNASLEANNQMTYLIIRNGENIYRLWTNIVFGDRLFPTQAEMDAMFKVMDDEHAWRRDVEREQDKEYVYKRNALIIQGLVDRTDFFQPLPAGASIFKPETYEGAFVLIRDDEMILDDGRPSWDAWKTEINSRIAVGSRILFVHPNEVRSRHGNYSKDFADRYLIYSAHDNYPRLPKTGIYQIERVVQKETWGSKVDYFAFRYDPGDEVVFGRGWTWDPHPRKNKVTFLVKADDDFIFNYDQIDLADTEYYLSTRKDKSKYIQYTMILWALRDRLLAEMERESHFINLVAGRIGVAKQAVLEAVSWWKFKNKWKRPLDKDDAKALRMIEGRLKSHP